MITLGTGVSVTKLMVIKYMINAKSRPPMTLGALRNAALMFAADIFDGFLRSGMLWFAMIVTVS